MGLRPGRDDKPTPEGGGRLVRGPPFAREVRGRAGGARLRIAPDIVTLGVTDSSWRRRAEVSVPGCRRAGREGPGGNQKDESTERSRRASPGHEHDPAGLPGPPRWQIYRRSGDSGEHPAKKSRSEALRTLSGLPDHRHDSGQETQRDRRRTPLHDHGKHPGTRQARAAAALRSRARRRATSGSSSRRASTGRSRSPPPRPNNRARSTARAARRRNGPLPTAPSRRGQGSRAGTAPPSSCSDGSTAAALDLDAARQPPGHGPRTCQRRRTAPNPTTALSA